MRTDAHAATVSGREQQRSSVVRTPRTKSTPIVEMYDSVYVSSANRSRRHDLPTPESPISSSLNR